jgi:hypothetical protein
MADNMMDLAKIGSADLISESLGDIGYYLLNWKGTDRTKHWRIEACMELKAISVIVSANFKKLQTVVKFTDLEDPTKRIYQKRLEELTKQLG